MHEHVCEDRTGGAFEEGFSSLPAEMLAENLNRGCGCAGRPAGAPTSFLGERRGRQGKRDQGEPGSSYKPKQRCVHFSLSFGAGQGPQRAANTGAKFTKGRPSVAKTAAVITLRSFAGLVKGA